ERERLLRVFGPDDFVRQFKRGVHVLLGVGQHVSADRLHARVRIAGVAGCAGRALGHREKAFESLARLLDASLSEIAQFTRDFKWRICHCLSSLGWLCGPSSANTL